MFLWNISYLCLLKIVGFSFQIQGFGIPEDSFFQMIIRMPKAQTPQIQKVLHKDMYISSYLVKAHLTSDCRMFAASHLWVLWKESNRRNSRGIRSS